LRATPTRRNGCWLDGNGDIFIEAALGVPGRDMSR
jgi:hypothetical protein